jgi:serine/threonine-protein kinase
MTAMAPGTIVDRYRVEGVIGAGSMGDVVRAVDVDLKRQVAIKILSTKHRDNKELYARFLREGRAVAAISHPNVVQVFTTGTFDARPYIAMEFLRGVDLGTVVREQGTMTSLQAARAALDAARGLEAAAKAGLIHRDVKPPNLVLLENGLVKVTDFGLAKPLDPKSEPALTAMGVVVGTPDYIAPEQARGEEVDERVDIYALGGTIYYLLTASPPFRKGDPNEDKYLKVVARHLKEPAPDARKKNSTVNPELAALTLRMMSKEPSDRPSYAELIEELTSLCERLQGSSAPYQTVDVERSEPNLSPTPFIGGADRLSPDLAAEDSSTESAARWRHRKRAAGGISRWLAASTAIAVIIFLVGVGLMLFGPQPAAEHPRRPVVEVEAAPREAVRHPVAPPQPPAGMLLVTRPDGGPWFFCAAGAVTLAEYADRFPQQKQKSRDKRKNRQPVIKVSFDYAQAYAHELKGRLPTPEEWQACAATSGFQPAGELWEWVDDGTEGAQAPRPVRGHPDRSTTKIPGGQSDVTFRVVRHLPESE